MTHNKSHETGLEFRWGLLGAGGIAREFAQDLSYLNNHIVAAVGSRTLENAQSWAIEFPGCKSYGSYAELVADPEIDAIYIATPHNFHAEQTIMALKAGKPVLCEKPFSINAKEARAMRDAAIENGQPLMEAMWTRFLPHIYRLREIIASGKIGVIITIEADHGQRLSDYGNPRHWEPELGGGALLDLGIYPISLAHMILGAPERITSSATFTDKGVDAQATAIFDYQSGAQAILSTTMSAKTSNRASICGTLGRIEIDATFYNPAAMRIVMHDGTGEEIPNNYKGHGLREEAIEFARIVTTGQMQSSLMTLTDTIEIMELLDKIRAQIGLVYPSEL